MEYFWYSLISINPFRLFSFRKLLKILVSVQRDQDQPQQPGNNPSTYSNLEYSNLISDQPLTQMANPKPKCIDSFCIWNHVLNLDHQPSYVCFYPCLLLCLFLLIVVLLLIVICLYCIDWTESYELRWKECVSNDFYQRQVHTPFHERPTILLYMHCRLFQ